MRRLLLLLLLLAAPALAQVTPNCNLTGTFHPACYNLGQFGATTSAQLRSSLSDETGTGAAVFADAPTMSDVTSGIAFTGTWATSTAYAIWAASAFKTGTGNFALIQHNTTGATIINAPAGQTVSLRNNNGEVAVVSSAGLDVTGTLSVGGVATTPNLPGTTGSIGGGALIAGQCTSGTVAVTNSTTSMTVSTSPNTYPGDGVLTYGYVSTNGTVTVKVCGVIPVTPTASTYNVRVHQ